MKKIISLSTEYDPPVEIEYTYNWFLGVFYYYYPILKRKHLYYVQIHGLLEPYQKSFKTEDELINWIEFEIISFLPLIKKTHRSYYI